MPLYANGTLIPENVANALTVNGVNITQVIANGVVVWTQALGPTVGWSGNTVVAGGDQGIFVSGFSYYLRNSPVSGAWLSVTSYGVFTSGNSAADPLTIQASGGSGFRIISTQDSSTSYVVYSTGSKTFSGTSMADFEGTLYGVQSSGGLLRWNFGDTYFGSWISLT